MQTRDDVFTEVLVRNNRTTTDAFVTDTILKNWYKEANVWAMSTHKWPFTEARLQTTYASGVGPNSDEWYFEGFKADSFRLITVGGKRLDERNFADYQILLEEEPGKTDRVFAKYGRAIYINPYADVSGTLVAYFQYQPYIDVTDETASTLFAGFDEEGNEAIVNRMSYYLKLKEHLLEEAIAIDKLAVQQLENVWQRVLDERYSAKTDPDRGGMFERFDVLQGRGGDDLLDRNQF